MEMLPISGSNHPVNEPNSDVIAALSSLVDDITNLKQELITVSTFAHDNDYDDTSGTISEDISTYLASIKDNIDTLKKVNDPTVQSVVKKMEHAYKSIQAHIDDLVKMANTDSYPEASHPDQTACSSVQCWIRDNYYSVDQHLTDLLKETTDLQANPNCRTG